MRTQLKNFGKFLLGSFAFLNLLLKLGVLCFKLLLELANGQVSFNSRQHFFNLKRLRHIINTADLKGFYFI